MKLKKILSYYYRRAFPRKAKVVAVQVGGQSLFVYEGSLGKTDKDDAWFHALARQHSVVYDVGANVGHTAMLACLHQRDKTMVLIDPNPEALRAAADNLARNKMMDNKTFIAAFAGNTSGEQQKFYTVGTGAAGSMYATHAETAAAVGAHSMVDTLTIDDIILQTQHTPTLVKIDVEGAEALALQGATQLAAQQQAVFMVEMHAPPELPMVVNAQRILNWCGDNGYTAWYMSQHTQLTDAQQLASRGRCHLLLLPTNMLYPAALLPIDEGDEIK
jgi:methyltransferase, FkbM family